MSKASFLGSGQWSPVDARSELGSNFSYHIYKKGNRSGGMLKCAGKARAENTQKKPFFCHASLLDMKWSTQISQKVLSTLCAKADFSRVSAWLSPPERLPKKMTHLNWWPGLTIQLGFGTLCM